MGATTNPGGTVINDGQGRLVYEYGYINPRSIGIPINILRGRRKASPMPSIWNDNLGADFPEFGPIPIS